MESTEEGTAELVIQVASLKVVSAKTKAAYDALRGRLERRLKPGRREKAWSPLDGNVNIGTITMTDPDKTADIVDKDAFLAWVAKNYPDKVKPDFELTGTREQIVDALYNADRQDLLKLVSVVDSEFVRDIRVASAKRGQSVGPDGQLDVPGVKVTKPPSVLRCLPGDDAEAEVAELLRSGTFSLDSLLLAGDE